MLAAQRNSFASARYLRLAAVFRLAAAWARFAAAAVGDVAAFAALSPADQLIRDSREGVDHEVKRRGFLPENRVWILGI